MSHWNVTRPALKCTMDVFAAKTVQKLESKFNKSPPSWSTNSFCGRCVAAETIRYPQSFRAAENPVADAKLQLRDGGLSTDGTCGPAHGNTVCDPNSTNYVGGCCSQYGFCGNTVDHCGTGCVSGNCLASSSSAPTSAPTGITPRVDGRCGTDFGGATCDPAGAYGGCCSQYGYCGKTDGHCLVANGCQNGCSGGTAPPSSTTTGEPVIAPVTSTLHPSATATAAVTTDGSCGTSNGNTVCGNWPNGNCCSMYGFW
ncbi:hypothetical protein B0J14DRAFT_81085 [Halenospora varia]|nr:hypothetical protein B0J14DRAFT_81085 [Halenospora varia]